MTPTTKVKNGEYLYKRGTLVKRIKRDAYFGNWNILAEEFTGAPPFAVGFRTKADAVEWLDKTWSAEEVGA